MDPFLELLAVLAAIYFVDCLQWVRREGVVFSVWWKHRFRAVLGPSLYGHETAGFALAQPLPPFGVIFVTQMWPVSLGPEAAYSHIAQAHNPGGKVPEVGRVVAWSEMSAVQAEGRDVLVNGKRFVASSSPRHARHIARVLVALRDTNAERRARAIEHEIASWFAVERARSIVADVRRASKLPNALGIALFTVLFGAVPLIGWRLGLVSSWPYLLGLLGLVHCATVVAIALAHRTLRPGKVSERIGELAPIVLAPPAAIRAADVLTRDALAEFHPLAAARALLDDGSFRALLDRVGFDAVHPLQPVCPRDEDLARSTESFYRARLVAELERFARSVGVDPARWTAPPENPDPDCVLFCPRCRQQFLLGAPACSPCFSMPLQPLVPPAGATPRSTSR